MGGESPQHPCSQRLPALGRPLSERRKCQAKLLSQVQKTLMKQEQCPPSLPTVASNEVPAPVLSCCHQHSSCEEGGTPQLVLLRGKGSPHSGFAADILLPYFICVASLLVAWCLLFLLQSKPHLEENPAAGVLTQDARRRKHHG